MSRAFQAFCVATCAFALFNAPATAATPDRPAIAVHYGDLDVTTQTGAEALLQRIERAAQRVCSVDAYGRWQSGHEARACRLKVVTKTVAKINQPMVTNLLAAHRTDWIVLA